MRAPINKVFVDLEGRPILERSLDLFEASAFVDERRSLFHGFLISAVRRWISRLLGLIIGLVGIRHCAITCLKLNS